LLVDIAFRTKGNVQDCAIVNDQLAMNIVKDKIIWQNLQKTKLPEVMVIEYKNKN